MLEHLLWTEKYRPKTVDECILPDRIKKVFQGCVKSNAIPNFMLSGKSGVGKTTIAIAMCEELNLDYILINASMDRGLDMTRTTVRNFASTTSFRGGRKVVILDEADELAPLTQATFRGLLEEFASNCSFIFTCNFKHKIIDAIHSRCQEIDFVIHSSEETAMQVQFFKRLQSILKEEKVKFEDGVLVKIIKTFFPDYRKTLNELQRFAYAGDIDAGILSQLSDVTGIENLYKFLRDKDFGGMRKWVSEHRDIESANLYRKIYDGLYTYFKPESIPNAVLILARYQYQAAFAADKEINDVACLTELMVDCEYAPL